MTQHQADTTEHDLVTRFVSFIHNYTILLKIIISQYQTVFLLKTLLRKWLITDWVRVEVQILFISIIIHTLKIKKKKIPLNVFWFYFSKLKN